MNRLHHIISGAAAALLLLSCQTSKEGVDDFIAGLGGGNGTGTVTDDAREPLDNVVGKPLSKWSEGYLDIHAVNSARGECTFFIYPDGTTMLCDAGEIGPGQANYPNVEFKPYEAKRPYLVYAEYIRHFLPAQAKDSLDYMYMTHFHNDHFGTPGAYDVIQRGDYSYTKTGIMALYDELPFRKIFDRSYDAEDPDYESVAQGAQEFSEYEDYVEFIKWSTSEQGLDVERIENGSYTQLQMLHAGSSYPGFSVMNNCVNGYIWDGEKEVDTYNRSQGQLIYENGMSGGFILKYDDFDYITSGDAGANTNVEVPLAKSINRKMEAMKSNHHFAWHTMNEQTMSIFQPKVIVSQSFYDHQPDMGYYDSGNQAFQLAWAAYGNPLNTPEAIAEAHDPSNPACKCWYFTNIHQHIVDWNENNYIFGADGNVENQMPKIKGMNGHVVIRVAPKGADGKQQFYVYMLVDTDFGYVVKQADGPFYCHEN